MFIETEDSTWGLKNYPKRYLNTMRQDGAIKSYYKYKQGFASMTKHERMFINQGTEKAR